MANRTKKYINPLIMFLSGKVPKFPIYKQLDTMDCGPTCLQMIAKHHGKEVELSYLRELCAIDRTGVSFDGISEAAESIGLYTIPVLLSYDTLEREVPLPCIAHWQQNHFVVVYHIKEDKVFVADPIYGKVKYDKKEFISKWAKTGSQDNEGHLLLLEPTADFENTETSTKKADFQFLWSYFKGFKKQIWQLVLGLIFASFLQLIFPFLTQAVVDYGINLRDLNFIYLILLAQVVLFISRASVEIVRGWILLYLTNKINIRLISDFLIRLIALPINYFESRNQGDILQRISDNRKIEDFLSSTSLTTLFSFFNILIFGFVLLYYDWSIFLVYVIGSSFYITWSMLFLKKRAFYDHEEFALNSDSQDSLLEIVGGIEDVKLHGSQRKRRWKWENLQIKLFKLSSKSLKLEQKQSYGAFIINELSNILITFLSAKATIQGEMTLGMMLAVQYILGQLNFPLRNITEFLKVSQDAKLSLERLLEAHNQVIEEDLFPDSIKTNVSGDIKINNLSFKYGPSSAPFILEDINLKIPENKTTAIVGVSGSGKTTLIKLLLNFYLKYNGEITIGNENLKHISPKNWRSNCGVVMQNGHIFNDTLLANICESETNENVDQIRLNTAIKVANLKEVIDNLPNGYNTEIGQSGVSLSGGERQRVFIARAIYKNPKYLFFDEATSALDANNENTIVERLDTFNKGKTVIVIAHRLSTVKKADNIVVLDKSRVVEQGTHKELVNKKGFYHTLIKNQLELGQ